MPKLPDSNPSFTSIRRQTAAGFQQSIAARIGALKRQIPSLSLPPYRDKADPAAAREGFFQSFEALQPYARLGGEALLLDWAAADRLDIPHALDFWLVTSDFLTRSS